MSAPSIHLRTAPRRRTLCANEQTGTGQSSIAESSDTSELDLLSDTIEYNTRQDIEGKLRKLRTNFEEAEQSGLELINGCVVECVELSNAMLSTFQQNPNDLPEYIRKRSKKIIADPSEMLRLVLRNCHGNPKKSSFYFRAVRQLYISKTPTKDYCDIISGAGGYQALANQNSRNRARSKTKVSEHSAKKNFMDLKT